MNYASEESGLTEKIDGLDDVGPALFWRHDKPRESTEAHEHRNLLLRMLLRQKKRKRAPAWTVLHNPVSIEQVGVFEVHVNTPDVLESVRDRLVAMAIPSHSVLSTPVQWFSEKDRPSSITDALLYAQPEKPIKEEARNSESLETVAKIYPLLESTILTDEQWKKNDYPTPGAGFMPSERSVDDPGPRVFALDCEMVETKSGLEVARATLVRLVDIDKIELVWDHWVLPEDPVVDYLTEHSGVTPAILDTVTFRFSDLQQSIRETVDERDILVGHSLENDLRTCKWMHRRVVDTAILFSPGRFKYSLRNLTAQLLQRQIQQDHGHSSEEDAIATLQLAVRRAVEGQTFGIWDKRRTNQLPFIAKEGTSVFLGPSEWLQHHVMNHPSSAHALSLESGQDRNSQAILAWLTGPKRRAKVVWSHWCCNTTEDVDHLDSFLADLLQKLDASQSIVSVNLQCGFKEVSALRKQRALRTTSKASLPWTPADEATWLAAVESCRVGSALWIGSQLQVASEGTK